MYSKGSKYTYETVVRPKYGMVKSFDPNGTDFTKDVLIEVNTGHSLLIHQEV